MMSSRYPAFTFYRNKSVARLTPYGPRTENDRVSKLGSVLFEFAEGENKKFDWENKITFSTNVSELAAIVQFLEPILNLTVEGKETKYTLVHDPNIDNDKKGQQVKTLTLSCTGEKFFLSLSIKTGEDVRKASVNMDYSQARLLCELCRRGIHLAMGWGPQNLSTSGSGEAAE